MGLSCSCFGCDQFRPERSPKENANYQNVGLLTKPHIMNTQGKQQQLEQDKGFTSLKDYLLASPALNGNHTSNGDEINLQVVKQNKVYPSLEEDGADYAYNPRCSSSKQRLLVVEVDSSSMDHVHVNVPSLLRRTRTEKIKKRVSFRLPEEADIFVYNIPEDDD